MPTFLDNTINDKLIEVRKKEMSQAIRTADFCLRIAGDLAIVKNLCCNASASERRLVQEKYNEALTRLSQLIAEFNLLSALVWEEDTLYHVLRDIHISNDLETDVRSRRD